MRGRTGVSAFGRPCYVASSGLRTLMPRFKTCVDHRRAHVLVPEELLHRANVVAVLQEVRSERVSQRVAARRLCKARLAYSFFHPALYIGIGEVVPTLGAVSWIDRATSRREHVLPAPLGCRRRVFPCQCIREVDRTKAIGEVRLVEELCLLKLPL